MRGGGGGWEREQFLFLFLICSYKAYSIGSKLLLLSTILCLVQVRRNFFFIWTCILRRIEINIQGTVAHRILVLLGSKEANFVDIKEKLILDFYLMLNF